MKLWLPSCPSKTVVDAIIMTAVQLQKKRTIATSVHKHVIVLIVHVYMITVHDTATVTDHSLSMYSDYAVFSNFTLAFFEDSGWYKVNYTFINNYNQFELQWGRGIYNNNLFICTKAQPF